MFELYANKNRLRVRRREPVTSGSVNVYEARFQFSEDWAGLSRTAVFRAGGVSVSVALGETGACSVPWEVLQKPGVRLEAGVYGTRGGEVVLPTVWADLGFVCAGAAPGEASRPPTPDLWRQELAKKGDKLDLEVQKNQRIEEELQYLRDTQTSSNLIGNSRDKPLSEVELRRISAPVEPLTNEDLEEMLK